MGVSLSFGLIPAVAAGAVAPGEEPAELEPAESRADPALADAPPPAG